MVDMLSAKHKILCTSRRYSEVTRLAKLRDFDLVTVGKYGEDSLSGKLESSIQRMHLLSGIIEKFSPDVVVSSCSPEAARIAFGLGIRHVACTDTPHGTAVMKLTVPLVQKLLIPHVIPKAEFIQYGIEPKNIIQYRAIDAAVTIRREIDRTVPLPFAKNNKKNILVRLDEEQAAYIKKQGLVIPIIKRLASEFAEECNIVVLSRYVEQNRNVEEKIGKKKVKVVRMAYDGKYLLENTDVFVGSGGTMTAESALMGVPTVTYGAVPNIIEDFLVRKQLVQLESDPEKVANCVRYALESGKVLSKERAGAVLRQMKDPITKIISVIMNE